MINYKITSLFFLFLLIGQLQAQEWTRKLTGPTNPVLTWTASNFSGQDVQQTNDGGYVMTGVQSYATGAPRDYPVLVKVNAQGFTLWEKSYYSDNGDVALFSKLSLVEMPNSNLLLAGLGQDGIHLVQTTPLGDTIWTKSFDSHCTQLGGPCYASALKLRATNDGNYMISVGMSLSLGAPFSPTYTQLIKVNPNGVVLWQKIHNNVLAEDLQATFDGGYILAGMATPSSSNIPMLYKLDMNGDSVWQQHYIGQPTDGLHSVVQSPDSGFVVATEMQGFVGPTPLVAKTDAQGNLLTWGAINIGTSTGGITGSARHVDYDNNGYYIVTGIVNKSHPILAVMMQVGYVAKLDLSGNLLIEQTFDDWFNNKGAVIRPTTDGGYIFVGDNSSSFSSLDMGYLVKADSLFNKPIHQFQGYIYRDNNSNCIKDAGETGLNNWIVQVQKGSTIHYTTTDSTGYYDITVDTGAFTIRAILNNGLWDFCVDSFVITSPNLTNSDTLNFGAAPLTNCPLLNVDISTPILRRCSTSVYTVNYCNSGTTDAQNSYVNVYLDTTLSVTGSSIPFTTLLGGGGYTFNLGTITSGACGTFTITTLVNCSVILGATHCVEAHIFPDSNCVTSSPLWDLSEIDLDGICYGDSIVYKIKNIGLGNMSTARQYFVTEDHVMLFAKPYQLNAGDSIIEVVHTSGGVYRLQAEQDPNHPYSAYTAFGVQMCVGATFTTTGIMGVLVQYSEDDGSPAVSIDCQQNVGSFDPNDKQVSPAGYGINHYIEANTDLEYHIRFQNTGTDTAFNIIIYDTLSNYLDASTIIAGASSHSYRWELKNSNVLAFYFDNVLLPDSNINEALSHGFIKFKIKQKASNPLGTIIYNQAGIVFDMNAPVFTNTTFSTLAKDFIVDVVRIGDRPQTQINVFPNPFQDQAVIKVEGEQFNELEVRVFDAMGRQVQYQQVINKEQLILHRQNLNTGVYFFQLIGDGEVIGAGKVVVQ